MIQDFINSKLDEEVSDRTIKKYTYDLTELLTFIKATKKEDITKEKLVNWKRAQEKNFKVSSVNGRILVTNSFLRFLKLDSLSLKLLKVQRRTSLENTITLEDYTKLLDTAKLLQEDRMYHIMITLAETGIRIGELQYITVDAVKRKTTTVLNKGKRRDIVISTSLSKDLLNYCKTNRITSGIVFTGKTDAVLDTTFIFKRLKYIAHQAKIDLIKVHAHSFRHLFAKTFLERGGDVPTLADLLGHSNLETTRIYTQKTISEQRETLDTILSKRKADQELVKPKAVMKSKPKAKAKSTTKTKAKVKTKAKSKVKV